MVATQGTPVATIKLLARSKLYRDIRKVCHDRIQERIQRTGHDRKLHAAIEANNKDLKLGRDKTFYVATKRPKLGEKFGDPQRSF